MTTFVGDFPCKVDVKGRIMLPAAFKKQLSEAAQDTFVAKKDIFDKCLVLYPLDEWRRQNEIIRAKINTYNKDHNRFLREFYRGTAELVLDATNRILLPKRLLDLVEIKSDVILAGQDGKIEIWSKSVYENSILDQEEFERLAQDIMGK